jgi:hypothetical protein
VAESLRIGLGTVSVVLERAKQAGLDWPTVQTLTEETLEARLYTRPLCALTGEPIGVLATPHLDAITALVIEKARAMGLYPAATWPQ